MSVSVSVPLSVPVSDPVSVAVVSVAVVSVVVVSVAVVSVSVSVSGPSSGGAVGGRGGRGLSAAVSSLVLSGGSLFLRIRRRSRGHLRRRRVGQNGEGFLHLETEQRKI